MDRDVVVNLMMVSPTLYVIDVVTYPGMPYKVVCELFEC